MLSKRKDPNDTTAQLDDNIQSGSSHKNPKAGSDSSKSRDDKTILSIATDERQLTKNNRALERLARILEGSSVCVAIYYYNNKLHITSNNEYIRNEQGEGSEHKQFMKEV